MSDEEFAIQETLDFLEEELLEKKNFKTINKYGGKGGFGLVLFVQDISTEKKYAVKAQSIINNNSGKTNNSLLKACKEEAQILRECNHKNVVEKYSEFEIGFYHFIQMDLCECSLDDWISRNQQPINDMLFLHYVNQMIDGIEYLHNKDLVLRDLSIRNILLTTNGVIKLCDFGLAKKYDDTFKSKILYTQTAKGIFFYFPPELFEDLKNNKQQVKQTKKGDIWALGVCLSLLGGVNLLDYLQVQNPEFIIPDSQYFSNKANQIVKFILNRNPEERPSIQQIREQIYNLFLKNNQEQAFSPLQNKKMGLKQISQEQSQYSQNSNDSTNYTESQQENQQIKDYFKQEICIERLIDFDFKEIEDIYEKYQKYVKEYPNNINVLITLGFIELKYKSNFIGSKKCFQKCVQLESNEIDAYLGLSEIIIQSIEYKNLNKASIYLEKCLSLRKDYWRIYYMFSRVYLLQGKDQLSINALEKGLELNNNSIQLLSLKISHCIYLTYDYEEAKILTEQIIQLNKENNPIIFKRIGQYFQCVNDGFIKAKFYYQQSLQYNSNDLDTLCDLILCLNENGMNEETQKYEMMAVNQYPENSYLIWVQGELELDENKKLNLFKKSIELDSSNKLPYHCIGKLLRNQNRYDEAIKEIEKILSIDPDDKDANHSIGYIFGFEKQEYNIAIKYYKNAIKPYSLQTDIFLELATLYKNLKDYENAIIYLNQTLQIDSKSSEAYNLLSQIEKEKNNDDKYIEFKQQQVELDPNNQDVLNELGIYYRRKNIEKSKLYFEKLKELNPNYPYINFNLDNLQENNNYQLDYNENEFRENPESDIALNNIGVFHQDNGNYDLAIEYYQQSIQINDQIQLYFSNLASAYQQNNQYELSVENYQNAILLDNKNEKTYKCLADLYYSIQEYDKANEVYLKVIDVNPKAQNIFYQLGKTYQKLKKYQQAINYYKKYTQFNPKSDNSYFQMAFIENTINKNFEKSLLYNQKAIQINPEVNSYYYRNAGSDCQNLKQYKQAKEYYLKAIQMDYQNQKDLYKNLAYFEKEQNNTIKGIEFFEKIISDLSDDEIRKYYQWYLEVQNFSKAYELLQIALKNNPDDKDNIFELGWLEYSQKNYHKAIIQFQKVLEKNSGCYQSIYNIGHCYYFLEDYDQALKYYYKFLKLNQNYQQSYFQIGKIEQQFKKEPKQAIKFLRKAIELDNQDVQSYYYLGLAFIDRKYPSEAAECFQKLLEFSPNFEHADFCKEFINSNKNIKKKKYKQTNVDDSDCNIF